MRVHRPSAAAGLPLLVYLHGGGWTEGSAAGVDALCTELAVRGECVVAAVDYRLAPQHPFPAGLDDCFAATAWLGERNARLAVGGSSAGANLAAAVALLARDRGDPHIVFQLLVYPPLDHAAVADAERAHFRRADIERHWSQYLPDRPDGDDPRASPLRATDLSRLPPALVITAEHDPLTEEATAYARRLVEAGVPAEIRHFAGAQHGFFASATRQGDAARTEAVAALRRAFAY